nr:MAG TPA: hypothetical protein [Caudoviricetes sp.]
MMNVFHEMVYKESRCEPQVLAHGFYHGRNYYVVSFGTHPCAYVDVSDLLSMTREEQEYIENAIDCHGGVTYSSAKLVVENKTGWYIGWDYAHCMDYSGYMYILSGSLAKRWTTPEMVSECKRVIDQIEGLVKELPKAEV